MCSCFISQSSSTENYTHLHEKQKKIPKYFSVMSILIEIRLYKKRPMNSLPKLVRCCNLPSTMIFFWIISSRSTLPNLINFQMSWEIQFCLHWRLTWYSYQFIADFCCSNERAAIAMAAHDCEQQGLNLTRWQNCLTSGSLFAERFLNLQYSFQYKQLKLLDLQERKW